MLQVSPTIWQVWYRGSEHYRRKGCGTVHHNCRTAPAPLHKWHPNLNLGGDSPDKLEADCDSYVYCQRQKQLQEPATNHSCHILGITYSNDNKLCRSPALIMLQKTRTQDWVRALCGRLLQHFAHCTGGTDANICLARQVDTSKYFVKNILLIFFLKPKGQSIWHPRGLIAASYRHSHKHRLYRLQSPPF